MPALARLPRRLLCAGLLALAGTLALGMERAGACSCADLDPRDRFESGEPALIGRVVSSGPSERNHPFGGPATRYVVRVERALNARLGEEVAVLGSDISVCGFRWRVGQRV